MTPECIDAHRLLLNIVRHRGAFRLDSVSIKSSGGRVMNLGNRSLDLSVRNTFSILAFALAFCIGVLLQAPSAHAQGLGGMTGTINDHSGAAVPNPKTTLTPNNTTI